MVGWELALAWRSVKMLVTPRPGVSMDNLMPDLQTSRDEAFNLRAAAATALLWWVVVGCSVPVSSAIT